jgi:hypothetical protein
VRPGSGCRYLDDQPGRRSPGRRSRNFPGCHPSDPERPALFEVRYCRRVFCASAVPFSTRCDI